MKKVSHAQATLLYNNYRKGVTEGRPLSRGQWLSDNKIEVTRKRVRQRRAKCKTSSQTSSSSNGSFTISPGPRGGRVSATSGHAYVVGLMVRGLNRRC